MCVHYSDVFHGIYIESYSHSKGLPTVTASYGFQNIFNFGLRILQYFIFMITKLCNMFHSACYYLLIKNPKIQKINCFLNNQSCNFVNENCHPLTTLKMNKWMTTTSCLF